MYNAHMPESQDIHVQEHCAVLTSNSDLLACFTLSSHLMKL